MMSQLTEDNLFDRITDALDPLYQVVYFYGDTELLSSKMDRLTQCYLKKHQNAKIECISAEAFTTGMITSVKYGIAASHPICFRDCDFLVLKDFQQYGGREASMQELYYILDWRLLLHKPFVICSDRKPNEILNLADRLLTILEGGLIYRYY